MVTVHSKERIFQLNLINVRIDISLIPSISIVLMFVRVVTNA